MDKIAGTADGALESEADFAALMTAVETAPTTALAVAALAEVRKGVITGEGPTTRGRVHDSRAIDVVDTGLIKRILLAGGADPVTRAEADALFDINDAALERLDGGAFADLFVKAIAHHVLSSAGYHVPKRASALARSGAFADWAPATIARGGAVRGEAAVWLASRLARKGRGAPAPLAALIGTTASCGSVAGVVDLAA
jgi:hypothetical protein